MLLDSSVLIAYLGPPRATSPVATTILEEFVRGGRNQAVISSVTAMELWVCGMTAPAAELEAIDEFIQHFPNLSVGPVDLATAHRAAALRAQNGMRTPDALIVATALVRQVRRIVTNDHDWAGRLRGIAGVAVIQLDAHLPFA